ncbi:MAG: DUF86 domain-containing protein [SAR324 cluster bacterium]|nr:DUF86 domain-containing protein [SAR324 cluster bacterium]
MRPEDEIRLRHMLDAATEALEFLADRNLDDLANDRKLALALVKEIEIIGEAAYQMAGQSRAEITDIPWPAVINMRHRLVHAYHDINLEAVLSTVQEDLPPLMEALEKFLDADT